jgi:L-2,4-diaminobutyrate decarboxylase
MSFIVDSEIVVDGLNRFREESVNKKKPVTNLTPLENIVENLEMKSFIKNGGLTGKKLFEFMSKYLSFSTRLHHPAYLGHQCAAIHYSGALASLIDAFTNNVTSIYEMGPAAVSLEFFTINWMLEKVGWNPAPISIGTFGSTKKFGGGVFVNGGSLGNLTALLAARNKVAPETWQKGNLADLALLISSESHYSVEKSAGIMGIGKNSIYYLETDYKGAVIPEKISTSLNSLLDDGKKPIALIANACSTPVGVYDPLNEIADFCIENNIWFHVDGAHGASALLSDKYKERLKGIEKADSLVWDAHKLLQTPSLCAALLVKEHDNLEKAMDHNASYLFHEKEQQGIDFIQRTIECTKSGVGIKLFFVLASIGEKGLRNYIDEQYNLAAEAYNFIKEQKDFECPVLPQSNILCFRINGTDSTQLKIRNKLVNEGSFYLTSTEFKGKRFLRMVFMSPNTIIQDIHKLINRIREINTEIVNNPDE